MGPPERGRFHEVDGRRIREADLCRERGIDVGTFRSRLARGSSVLEALRTEPETLAERLERACCPEPNTGCWLWCGTSRNGYGSLVVAGKRMYAHRASYETHVGPIPEELTLDHLCRTPLCINPAHLEPVTRGENVLRGVAASAVAARRNHCERGHEYTPENTRTTRGWRECRQCAREKKRTAEYREAFNRKRRAKYASRKSAA